MVSRLEVEVVEGRGGIFGQPASAAAGRRLALELRIANSPLAVQTGVLELGVCSSSPESLWQLRQGTSTNLP